MHAVYGLHVNRDRLKTMQLWIWEQTVAMDIDEIVKKEKKNTMGFIVWSE